MDGRITSRAGDPKSAARQHVSTGVIPHTSCPIPPPDIRRLETRRSAAGLGPPPSSRRRETADQPPVWVRRRAAAGRDRRPAADLAHRRAAGGGKTADQPAVWVRRRAAAGLDRRLAAGLPQSAGQPAAYRGALHHRAPPMGHAADAGNPQERTLPSFGWASHSFRYPDFL